jgi:chorismate mutase
MNEVINQNRVAIDEIDKSIIDLLRQRFDASAEIGRQKRILGAKVLDASREAEVLDARAEYAVKQGLNPEFVKNIIQLIMDESKSLQEHLDSTT